MILDGPGTRPRRRSAMQGDDSAAELAALRARVAALESEAAAGKHTPPRHRTRSLLAALLIIVGCVLAPLGIVAAWTYGIVGNTDRYVSTVAPLASDPDVQEAAANRVTAALMQHLDLTALLEDVAPDQRPLLQKALGKLGGSLESAVSSFVKDKAQDVIASKSFETIWTDANRTIHTALVKALTGSGDGAVQIKNDAVTIDLAPVIDQVKTRLVDSGMSVAGKIPEIHTDFTVVQSNDIGRVKTGFRLLQILGVWLPVLAVILIVAGILLSARRRRAVVTSALAVAFAALVLGLALTVFRTVYLNALPDTVSQAAAGSVYDALIRLLRTTVRMVVVLGVVVALAAWLSGPGRYSVAARQIWHSGIAATRASADRLGLRTGPVGPFIRRHRPWFTWGLVAVAALVYLLWSYPTGWVVVGLALALLFALAVTDFIAEDTGEHPSADKVAGPHPS
ncbi:membrane protein [Streptomyces sp. Mg1]|nr:membrane protein [Streptomyces sp. Mg1]